MERLFRPCQGKNLCREDENGCQVCGRDAAEINQTRDLVDALTRFALEQGYSNVDEFAAYIARRLEKKVAHAREKS